jgi:hypothetical protein
MQPGEESFSETVDQFLGRYCQRGPGFHISDRQLFAQLEQEASPNAWKSRTSGVHQGEGGSNTCQ